MKKLCELKGYAEAAPKKVKEERSYCEFGDITIGRETNMTIDEFSEIEVDCSLIHELYFCITSGFEKHPEYAGKQDGVLISLIADEVIANLDKWLVLRKGKG